MVKRFLLPYTCHTINHKAAFVSPLAQKKSLYWKKVVPLHHVINLKNNKKWLTKSLTSALLAAPVSTSALLELSPKATSTRLTLTPALAVVPALTHAPLVQLSKANRNKKDVTTKALPRPQGFPPTVSHSFLFEKNPLLLI